MSSVEISDIKSLPTQLYRHYDADGILLYVGISLSSIYRLSQHKAVSNWAESIKRVEITQFNTREDAMLAERKAVEEEQPVHNKRLKKTTNRKKIQQELKQETINNLVSISENVMLSKIVHINPVYTLEEAARELKCTKHQVLLLIRSGRLSAIKIPNATNTKMVERITGWQLVEFLMGGQ